MKTTSSLKRTWIGTGMVALLIGVSDLTLGMSGLWTLADAELQARYRLDEGSGTSAGDLTGNGNTGTFTGSPTWDSSDPSGNPYAVAFDGTDDYIETSKDATDLGIGGAGAKTISAWVYTESFNSGGIFDLGDYQTGENFSLRTLTSDDNWRVQFWGADQDFTYPSKDKWVHFALTYDGTIARVYADGVEQATKTTTLDTTDTVTFRIGRWKDDYFDGKIDEVRVYSRALSATEVAGLAHGGGRLEGLWHLEEGTGTAAADDSGNDQDGTVNGATWTTSGKEGNALDFDGTDDYVGLGSNYPGLRKVKQATLAAFIKADTAASAELISISKNAGSATSQSRANLKVVVDGSNLDVAAGGRSTDTEGYKSHTATGADLSTGQWYHLAAVIDYENDSVAIYVDGTLSSSGTASFDQTETPDTDSTSQAIGAEDDASGGFFDGLMDEVRIYSRALTADEIKGLAGGTGTGLAAVYYDNKDWTGTTHERTDETIDFQWGSGSPDMSIGADTFSAVWTGQLEARWNETYTLFTTTDDGVKLWVDGDLVIDHPINQGPTEYSAPVALEAGKKVDLRMEYFENTGGAVAELRWQSASTPKAIIPKEQLYPTDGVTPAFVSATAESADLQTVYLRFSEPMDKTTSETAGNYTVSGPITVNSATLSSDKRVVTLAVASNVTLGTTTVTASASIKSIAQEVITQTQKTIVAGNSMGFPDSTAITLGLATDADNQGVIQRDPGPGGFDIPDKGIKVDLTVTAPGVSATTVDLKQAKLVDGKSVIYFGLTGSQTETSVTTSGGTPNSVVVKVRGQTAGAFQSDFKIVANVSGQEQGEKLSTVVNLSYSPACVQLSDQRPVKQTVTASPAIQGLKIENTTWVVTRGNHASPTALFKAPDFPDTGADGKAKRTFSPCGTECYGADSPGLTGMSGNSITSDYKEPQNCEHCEDEDSDDPGKKLNEGSGPCKCGAKKDTSPEREPQPTEGARKGVASVDTSKNSIDLSDGEKKLDIADLVIRGRGLHYVFRRIYRSHDYRATIASANDRGGDFGEHWTFTYADEYLLKDGTGDDDDANFVYFRHAQTGGLFINVSSGVWEAPLEAFVGFRKNPNTGDFEIRQNWGEVRTFHDFSDTNTPNKNGRLKAIEDRIGNRMTFHYEEIDPDGTASSGDEKYVLAYVVDSLGREIRYQYFAATAQTVNGRPVTTTTTNTDAYGRLFHVKDFKGNMDFTGAEQPDFPGQDTNRQFQFGYDSEGNLVKARSPIVKSGSTPTGNDFPSGKTFRYRYITTSNRGGLTQTEWDALSQSQKDRLLHNVTHIWYPNEVKNSPDSDPPDGDAAQVITYETDASDPFFGYVTSYQIGGQNGNGVPSGGTIFYTWTDLNPARSMPAGVAADPTKLYTTQTLKVEVVDRNGNDAEYIFGGGRMLLEYREKTLDNFRTTEPDNYLKKYEYNGDRYLTKATKPLTNVVDHTFNSGSSDRNQQGNVIRSVRTPDGRGGDQDKIEMVYVYEPIYNRPCLVVQARGSDTANNGFTPPVADVIDRTMTDPYDSNKTLDLRYSRVEFFDYQEATEKATNAPDTRLDIDGSGGKVNASPLISVDGNVLTTEVWLVQELGLSEDSSGLTELRDRLSDNLTNLGLGDLNGDNDITPTVAGNIVRTVFGSPVILEDTNQDVLETTIDPADLIDESKTYGQGGSNEGTEGDRLQTIVWMYQYNRFGQVVQTISPEGNVTTHEYFAEIDPDGDGNNTPTPADGRTLETDDSETDRTSGGGGYVHLTTLDRTRTDSYVKFYDQSGNNKATATFHNNDTAPTATDIKLCSCIYDDVGNRIQRHDPRGIRYDMFVNELDEVVEVTSASDVSEAANADPSDPLYNHSDTQQKLTAFSYLSRTFYDFNGNVVLSQVEDRGNTSSVDGSGLGTLPSQATDTTPGLSSADGTGNEAWVDTLMLYDRLDNLIEIRQEVDSSTSIDTRYRYDGNEHQVLMIYPEGNAASWVYDERELLFQMIKGTSARPAAGKYAAGDPTTFNRPGGAGTAASTFTYNYDDNRNLVETVDAADTDSDTTNNSTVAGDGDRTEYEYDGYDRPIKVIDPDGNFVIAMYDPDSNVVRTVSGGDPSDDEVGGTVNRTLAWTEQVHDSLSRVVTAHQVLFKTPDITPANAPTLTDGTSMDSLASYLSDANSDTAGLPTRATDLGAVTTSLTVIGRVSSIQEYDRASRGTFGISDDLDLYRTDYDGVSRSIRTMDSHVATGFSAGAFDPANQKGNVVLQAYDDNSNVIEVREYDVMDLNGDGTADAFDANHDGSIGAADTVLDFDLDGAADAAAEVFRTTMLYDSLNRLQTLIDNVSQTIDSRYDSRSSRVSAADAQGPVATRAFARRWENPFDSGDTDSTSITINDFGNVTRGRFDGIGRLLESEVVLTASGQGDGSSIGGTLEGIQAKSGGDVDYSDVPTPDTNQSADGLVSVSYAYDDNSQLLGLRDDNGNTTVYIYDNQNRRLVERKGLAETGTSFTITGGDTGAFVVALRGGTTPVDTESSGTDIATTYDQDSNVTQVLDEAGNDIDYTYDALNRRKDLSITPASGFIGTTNQTWKYDGLSRQSECTDNNDSGTGDDVTCRYFYDSLSRKVEEGQEVGAGNGFRNLSCSYDIQVSGAVWSPSQCVYPDGRKVDSTYDTLDRLVDRTDNGGSYTPIGTYAYIGKGREATLTFQNETRLTHLGQTTPNAQEGYDGIRRITRHRWESFTAPDTTPGNDTLLVGFGHEFGSVGSDGRATPAYDRMSNKLIEEKLHDSDSSEVYVYDSAYRVALPTSTYRSPAPSSAYQRGTLNANRDNVTTLTTRPAQRQKDDWTLDGVGNWASNPYTDQGVTAVTETRSHTDFNEINQRTISTDNTTQALDKNGNITDTGQDVGTGGARFFGGGLRMEWDALNRLRKVYYNANTPGSTGDDTLIAEYSYDCGNRRMRRVFTNNTSALNGTTEYFYEGWRVYEEQDGSGGILQQYVYGIYLDEVWTLDDRRSNGSVADLNDGSGSSRRFYHCNTLYSIFALTDETGAIVEAYQYNAYGTPTVWSGAGTDATWFTNDDIVSTTTNGAPLSAVGNPYLYTSQHYDPLDLPETSVSYYKARYVQTDLGRFLSRDRFTSTTQSRSYDYGLSNPTAYVDTYGLDTWRAVGMSTSGMIVFAGWGSFVGKIENLDTGEECDITMLCGKLGGGVGISGGAKTFRLYGGPCSGKLLEGTEVSAFAEGAVGAVLMPEASFTYSAGSNQFSAGLSVLVGAGLELAAGGQWCKTTISNCKGRCRPCAHTPVVTPSRPGKTTTKPEGEGEKPKPPKEKKKGSGIEIIDVQIELPDGTVLHPFKYRSSQPKGWYDVQIELPDGTIIKPFLYDKNGVLRKDYRRYWHN